MKRRRTEVVPNDKLLDVLFEEGSSSDGDSSDEDDVSSSTAFADSNKFVTSAPVIPPLVSLTYQSA